MKKWSKVMSGAALTSLLVGMLAGCGSSNASSNNGASDKIASGQTITIWTWKNGDMGNAGKQIAEDWAKKHGDTIKWVDETSNPHGYDQFKQAARSANGPDLAFGIPVNIGTLHKEGLISEVPSQYVHANNFAPGVVSSVTYQGKGWYALPLTVESIALFYNKNMIPNPPKTWDEFVNDANQKGFMFDQANFYFNYAFIAGLGGYIFKENNGALDPKDIGLNNDGSVAAFQLLRDMNTKYNWMTPNVTGAIAGSKFYDGKIGMTISGPWDIQKVKDSKFPIGIAALPTLSNNKPATPFLGVQTVIVSAKSKNQAADWSLADALSNADAQTQYLEKAQQIPALTSVQQSSAVQNSPLYTPFASESAYAQAVPNISEMDAVWGAMGTIQNIINGKVTAKQGADDFVNNIKKGIQLQGN